MSREFPNPTIWEKITSLRAAYRSAYSQVVNAKAGQFNVPEQKSAPYPPRRTAHAKAWEMGWADGYHGRPLNSTSVDHLVQEGDFYG